MMSTAPGIWFCEIAVRMAASTAANCALVGGEVFLAASENALWQQNRSARTVAIARGRRACVAANEIVAVIGSKLNATLHKQRQVGQESTWVTSVDDLVLHHFTTPADFVITRV